MHVEQVLEIRVGDDGVELAVRERQRLGVEIDLLRVDAPAARTLGPDRRHVGADHLDAVPR